MWKLIAQTLAWPPIASYLVKRAMHTPYSHLDGYMNRYWLVPIANPFVGPGCGPINPWRSPLVALIQRMGYAIRIHHILREDQAPDLHNHPWAFRTVILGGWYAEERPYRESRMQIGRFPGDTAVLAHGELHKIACVSYGGAWTLFISGPKLSSWGFMQGGRLIPHWLYQGRN